MKKGETRTIRIGAVGVDSGQLLIADPCYIFGGGFAEKARLACPGRVVRLWGVDAEKAAETLCGGFSVEQRAGGAYEAACADLDQANSLSKRLASSGLRLCHSVVEPGDVYDMVCGSTNNPETRTSPKSASLRYVKGHEGLGVVFGPGLGDGIYAVYATFKNFGGRFGKRIVKVEILCEPDESP
jgi:hypothetical protein